MPIPAKMPVGTRVKHKDGRTGATTEFKPSLGAAGGYRVKWDADGSESEALNHQLDLEAGVPSAADYDKALTRLTDNMGGVTETAEGNWLDGNGKLVESVLVVSRPARLGEGEELHAHVNRGGGIRKVHIKSGNGYVRNVYADGKNATGATAEDIQWLSNYRLRTTMKADKQSYLNGKKTLPT